MIADNPLTLTSVPYVNVGMGIRRPREDVFSALVNPANTTQFWFTKSSGAVEAGATLTWEWEMYGVVVKVLVREVEANSRILIEWGGGEVFRPVEITLERWGENWTYVEISERGFDGSGDDLAAWLADSTGGFSLMLCALKAFLEHGIVLSVVRDRYPTGSAG